MTTVHCAPKIDDLLLDLFEYENKNYNEIEEPILKDNKNIAIDKDAIQHFEIKTLKNHSSTVNTTTKQTSKILSILRKKVLRTDSKNDTQSPCSSSYEFDATNCKYINDRLLCGYERNKGNASKSVQDLGNGCRYVNDRIECGYLVGPFQPTNETDIVSRTREIRIENIHIVTNESADIELLNIVVNVTDNPLNITSEMDFSHNSTSDSPNIYVSTIFTNDTSDTEKRSTVTNNTTEIDITGKAINDTSNMEFRKVETYDTADIEIRTISSDKDIANRIITVFPTRKALENITQQSTFKNDVKLTNIPTSSAQQSPIKSLNIVKPKNSRNRRRFNNSVNSTTKKYQRYCVEKYDWIFCYDTVDT
ncbi:uncharacterized protein LOC126976878 isoform X2 [Leptidea sinapis]|nr:uncharacterized protein LOC126976878 isoform X2 [Leptidea sinapis]